MWRWHLPFETMGWITLVVAFLILLVIGFWQLVIAEGVYFGPRVVAFLYDRTAHRYDRLKDFNAADEAYFLGRPLATALSAWDWPIILDVATGTGRLPQTLLNQPGFEGHVFGPRDVLATEEQYLVLEQRGLDLRELSGVACCLSKVNAGDLRADGGCDGPDLHAGVSVGVV